MCSTVVLGTQIFTFLGHSMQPWMGHRTNRCPTLWYSPCLTGSGNHSPAREDSLLLLVSCSQLLLSSAHWCSPALYIYEPWKSLPVQLGWLHDGCLLLGNCTTFVLSLRHKVGPMCPWTRTVDFKQHLSLHSIPHFILMVLTVICIFTP